MNSTIQKLNETICQEYTIEVSCDQRRILDNYEDGESGFFYQDFHSSKKESTVDNIGSSIKETVDYILKTYTKYNSFEEYCNEYDNDYEYDDESFIVCQLVNEVNDEPSEDEIESWKKGDIDLYNQYTHINLKVNSALLDFEMIRSLIEGSN